MIDPLETILAYFRHDATLMDLLNERIATKWQPDWRVGHAALTVRLDGGTVDLFVKHHLVTLDLRCYGKSQIAAMLLWREILLLSQRTVRTPVVTQEGNALIYYLHPLAPPTFLYDPQINSDFVFCPFRADIAQESVP